MMIKVNIRFYGMICDMIGKEHDSLDVPKGITVGELFQTEYKEIIADHKPQISYAINNCITTQNTVVDNGDTIDVMPPFAGG